MFGIGCHRLPFPTSTALLFNEMRALSHRELNISHFSIRKDGRDHVETTLSFLGTFDTPLSEVSSANVFESITFLSKRRSRNASISK